MDWRESRRKTNLFCKDAKMNKPLGYVLYHGPSLLNGEDIVVVATGDVFFSNKP